LCYAINVRAGVFEMDDDDFEVVRDALKEHLDSVRATQRLLVPVVDARNAVVLTADRIKRIGEAMREEAETAQRYTAVLKTADSRPRPE
jgi:hypothetical protein